MDKDDLILISVDDHIAEPADMFDAHVPEKYKDKAPRVVIEDSGPGVRAARAAGMDCIGYAPAGDVFGLAGLGAWIVASLDQVPALIAARLREEAA